jgi:hypothetical protein
MTQSTTPVTDLVLFSLKPGTTREHFLATVDPVSQWALEQPGFISRDLSYVPAEDRWIEVVSWETLADSERAAEAELSAEACMPMFGLIDWDTIVIMRGEAAIAPVRAGSGREAAIVGSDR